MGVKYSLLYIFFMKVYLSQTDNMPENKISNTLPVIFFYPIFLFFNVL